MTDRLRIESAEVVLSCPDLDATLAFFTERLGFRVAAISPADDPAVVVVAGHGLRLRLERDGAGPPAVLRLACAGSAVGGATELIAPNGTRVLLAPAEPPVELPPLRPAFVFTPMSDAGWRTGRAGMRYRDLVPDRQGGRFIASHIRIAEAGPVPDYVHFHRVRFQMIYCYKGWVRVVYEDQGPPFVLSAGDCVLQPPRIRHRVLESSPGLEVIEVTCPARHDTIADFELELPTSAPRSERTFDGQRFVRHEAAAARFRPWGAAGFEARDLGIAAATGGLADARVVRSCGASAPASLSHEAELSFKFLLHGSATLGSQSDG
ncbi:MAG TPA: cupin, partial [Vicinamibacteria bacterium]|nr:cupin [Vicinamibacteria bacterium]